MASENETVESVIQDMRGERYSVSGMPNLHMRDYAYRIESAWRREKEKVMQAATDVAMAPTQVSYEPRPKRNCDRFDCYEDAWDAFNAICDSHTDCYESCELYHGENTYGTFECFGRWLFAPVAEGGVK